MRSRRATITSPGASAASTGPTATRPRRRWPCSTTRADPRPLHTLGGNPTLSDEGPLLLDAQGNRNSGTGEHVVWLKPHFVGERVLPEATITVVAWQPAIGAWERRGEPFKVLYMGEPV